MPLTNLSSSFMTLRTDPELAGASNAKLRPYFVLSVAAALTCILALETGCNSLGIAVAQVLSTHEGDSLVYVAVEEMPQPVGGLGALASQVKIPATAWAAGVEGTVFLDIVVDEQGGVADARVFRGLEAGLDEEVLRVVRQAKFTPGRQDGKAVKVRMTLPILFKLSESSEPTEPSDSVAGEADTPAFLELDEMPVLVGGPRALLRQIIYPKDARRAGIQGQVYVTFVVDEHGNVVNAKIARGIGGGLDEEALRVVRSAKFIPGQKDGVAVRVSMTIPILFRLR